MALTYSGLVTAISDYSENTFSTVAINTIISRTEQYLHNATDLVPYSKHVVTVPFVVGAGIITFPVDFLSVYSFGVIDSTGNIQYLWNKDYDFIRSVYPNNTTQGLPRYYAMYDQSSVLGFTAQLTAWVGPIPDQAYNTELHYFAYPESIVTAGTSWIGNNFDFALLNGCLWEAAIYMKQESHVLQGLKAKFDESVQALRILGDGKQGTDQYRAGRPKVLVT